MASYAFRTPPRVAHAKPPGPIPAGNARICFPAAYNLLNFSCINITRGFRLRIPVSSLRFPADNVCASAGKKTACVYSMVFLDSDSATFFTFLALILILYCERSSLFHNKLFVGRDRLSIVIICFF